MDAPRYKRGFCGKGVSGEMAIRAKEGMQISTRQKGISAVGGMWNQRPGRTASKLERRKWVGGTYMRMQ
jgi:hypothetical protein